MPSIVEALGKAVELAGRLGAGMGVVADQSSSAATQLTAVHAEATGGAGGAMYPGATHILTGPVSQGAYSPWSRQTSPGGYSPWSRGTILGVNGNPINSNYTGIGAPGGPSGNLVGNSGTPGVGGGAFTYPIISGSLGLGEGMPGIYNPYQVGGLGKQSGPVPTIDATAPTQVRLLAQVAQGVQQLVAQTKSDNGASLRAKGLV